MGSISCIDDLLEGAFPVLLEKVVAIMGEFVNVLVDLFFCQMFPVKVKMLSIESVSDLLSNPTDPLPNPCENLWEKSDDRT